MPTTWHCASHLNADPVRSLIADPVTSLIADPGDIPLSCGHGKDLAVRSGQMFLIMNMIWGQWKQVAEMKHLELKHGGSDKGLLLSLPPTLLQKAPSGGATAGLCTGSD